MTLLDAKALRVNFAAHPNTTLGDIAARDVSYLDFLASQSWLDFHLREAVDVLCEHYGRKPKRAIAKSDGGQMGLGL